jgi:hypothetical protein
VKLGYSYKAIGHYPQDLFYEPYDQVAFDTINKTKEAGRTF